MFSHSYSVYPDHGHHGRLPLSRKNTHGRAANRTRDLMVSSQKLWPLSHEAYFNIEYKFAFKVQSSFLRRSWAIALHFTWYVFEILSIRRIIISNQAFLAILYRTGWTVQGSNPGRGEIFRTNPDWPWTHTVFNTVGVGLFLELKRPRRGIDHPPHLAQRLKKEYMSAAILGLSGWTLNFLLPVPLTPVSVVLYTRVNKNPSVWNFLSPKPEVTCGTVAIIIRVVLLFPYLRIRAVSLSSIHYNQSHRVYINRRWQYICLIWN